MPVNELATDKTVAALKLARLLHTDMQVCELVVNDAYKSVAEKDTEKEADHRHAAWKHSLKNRKFATREVQPRSRIRDPIPPQWLMQYELYKSSRKIESARENRADNDSQDRNTPASIMLARYMAYLIFMSMKYDHIYAAVGFGLLLYNCKTSELVKAVQGADSTTDPYSIKRTLERNLEKRFGYVPPLEIKTEAVDKVLRILENLSPWPPLNAHTPGDRVNVLDKLKLQHTKKKLRDRLVAFLTPGETSSLVDEQNGYLCTEVFIHPNYRDIYKSYEDPIAIPRVPRWPNMNTSDKGQKGPNISEPEPNWEEHARHVHEKFEKDTARKKAYRYTQDIEIKVLVDGHESTPSRTGKLSLFKVTDDDTDIDVYGSDKDGELRLFSLSVQEFEDREEGDVKVIPMGELSSQSEGPAFELTLQSRTWDSTNEYYVYQLALQYPAPATASISGDSVLNLVVQSFGRFLRARPLLAGAAAASSSKTLRVGGNDSEVLVELKDEQSGDVFSIAIVPFNGKWRVELTSPRTELLAAVDRLSWMGHEIKFEREHGHVFLMLTHVQAKSYCFHASKDEVDGKTACLHFTKIG